VGHSCGARLVTSSLGSRLQGRNWDGWCDWTGADLGDRFDETDLTSCPPPYVFMVLATQSSLLGSAGGSSGSGSFSQEDLVEQTTSSLAL
jgi:hypothetical protein